MTGPAADDLTAPLLDPGFYAGDPFPLYARFRAEAPLVRNESLGFWVASRHADVVTVSRDPETFCSGRGIMVFEIGNEYATPPTMMHTDPPAHTRYRNLVQPGFRPTFVRSLEDGVRARTRALVDGIEAGTPVDMVSEAVWFRDYAAYCGTGTTAKGGLFAVVAQLGARRAVVQQQIGKWPQAAPAEPVCKPAQWQREPMRVTLQATGGEALTFDVVGAASLIEEGDSADSADGP